MEDHLWWVNGDQEEHLHGYGHYHEEYRKENGRWLISRRALTRLRVDTTPHGSTSAASPHRRTETPTPGRPTSVPWLLVAAGPLADPPGSLTRRDERVNRTLRRTSRTRLSAQASRTFRHHLGSALLHVGEQRPGGEVDRRGDTGVRLRIEGRAQSHTDAVAGREATDHEQAHLAGCVDLGAVTGGQTRVDLVEDLRCGTDPAVGDLEQQTARRRPGENSKVTVLFGGEARSALSTSSASMCTTSATALPTR